MQLLQINADETSHAVSVYGAVGDSPPERFDRDSELVRGFD